MTCAEGCGAAHACAPTLARGRMGSAGSPSVLFPPRVTWGDETIYVALCGLVTTDVVYGRHGVRSTRGLGSAFAGARRGGHLTAELSASTCPTFALMNRSHLMFRQCRFESLRPTQPRTLRRFDRYSVYGIMKTRRFSTAPHTKSLFRGSATAAKRNATKQARPAHLLQIPPSAAGGARLGS